ncbi:hypothetical protein T440DRAFT_514659 [Plenodomus tracheiphilus IPT5]|uniref:ASST-domain-containing protein n=1 Tax=Plenodomus tracheiphilus IPT5 TaxID=1408161 RepID=A0A6A7BHA7_9PLEO|nr:hypothetical protein T440DRAFT_514659 [Plenodomus tracheiphilus IPT5]
MRSFILSTLLYTPFTSAYLSPFSSTPLKTPALHRRQSPNTTTWPYQTFKTETTFLPPILNITSSHPTTISPHPLFLAINCATCAQQAATIFSPSGDLLWQSEPSAPSAQPATNFSPQLLHGKPVLVYNVAVGPPIVASGALTYSMVLIYDDSYTLLHNISVVDPTFRFAEGSAQTTVSDAHEALITPDNTLLVPAYNITPFDLSAVGGAKEGWLLDCVVYEVSVPEGEVLWTWKASEHVGIEDSFVGLDAVYGFGNSSQSAWDYFHLNSIQAWGEEGVVVSARNTWDVLGLDKRTGGVEWRLRGAGQGGDIELEEEGRFSWQHDARLHERDGEVLLSLFDNRNSLEPPFVPSEGHLLSLDLENKTAKVNAIYVDRNTTIASQFGGSMQVNFNDGYVIIGHGSQPVTEEYGLDGTLRASWRFGPADANFGIPGIANYRSYKSEWKGYPTTAPKVVACKTVNGTDVYVSWNGATEVEGWAVYVGQEEESMLESISAEKTGFETRISMEEMVAWVKVQAVGDVHDERFTAQSSAAVAVQEC